MSLKNKEVPEEGKYCVDSGGGRWGDSESDVECGSEGGGRQEGNSAESHKDADGYGRDRDEEGGGGEGGRVSSEDGLRRKTITEPELKAMKQFVVGEAEAVGARRREKQRQRGYYRRGWRGSRWDWGRGRGGVGGQGGARGRGGGGGQGGARGGGDGGDQGGTRGRGGGGGQGGARGGGDGGDQGGARGRGDGGGLGGARGRGGGGGRGDGGRQGGNPAESDKEHEPEGVDESEMDSQQRQQQGQYGRGRFFKRAGGRGRGSWRGRRDWGARKGNQATGHDEVTHGATGHDGGRYSSLDSGRLNFRIGVVQVAREVARHTSTEQNTTKEHNETSAKKA